MRKFLIVILTFLYLCAANGTNIYLHYCSDEITELAIRHDKSKKCGKCGLHKSVEKTFSNCKVEHQFVKNDSEQIRRQGIQFKQFSIITLADSFYELQGINLPSTTTKIPYSHAPPLYSSVAYYILHNRFLI